MQNRFSFYRLYYFLCSALRIQCRTTLFGTFTHTVWVLTQTKTKRIVVCVVFLCRLEQLETFLPFGLRQNRLQTYNYLRDYVQPQSKMPSKEDICVQDSLPESFLSSDVEELVAAIKHNLHLKSKPSHNVYSKHRRMSPYAAPVRSVCRNKMNNSEIAIDHSSPNCKYCLLRSKSSKNSSQDPYEILTLLSKGILINEAVKRLQKDIENKRPKKTDFYDSDDVEVAIESV